MNCQIPAAPAFGADVEARLDQRQPRQLHRQAGAAEDPLHLRQIAPRDLDARREALAQAGLRADAILRGGSQDLHRILDIAEQGPYGALLVGEPLPVGAVLMQPPQGVAYALLLAANLVRRVGGDLGVAEAPVGQGREIDHFVDAIQVE